MYPAMLALLDWSRRLLPARSPSAGLPNAPVAQQGFANQVQGKPLAYLIGSDVPNLTKAAPDAIVHVGYDGKPVAGRVCTAYCNLFDEKNTGKFGPYLHSSDTAAQYSEGQIDPRGAGWKRNLDAQFTRRWAEGFRVIELDNPDAYQIDAIVGALDLAEAYGFQVFAKNPGLLDKTAESVQYVRHSSVIGIIVERGAGDPSEMDVLRKAAGKSNIPVWFVFFDKGISSVGAHAAQACARDAKDYPGMFVTYSPGGEYTQAIPV